MKKTKEIEEHLAIALKEIGEIEPWWSEEDGMFVFEHPAYPMVVHGDPDKAEAKAGYLRAIQGFIEDRLIGQVADNVDRITSGRGGVRPGAGRPAGTTKTPTKMVRLPVAIANWIKADPSHLEQVEKLMQR